MKEVIEGEVVRVETAPRDEHAVHAPDPSNEDNTGQDNYKMDIAVIGGSIGGLSAAISLLRNLNPKPRLHVFERSPNPLEDRGAGLAISLGQYATVTGDEDLTHLVYERHRFSRSQMLNLQGQIVSTDIVTPTDQPRPLWRGTVSYDNIMTALLAVFNSLSTSGSYNRGKRATRVDPIKGTDKTRVTFDDGSTFDAHLVIGADGYMSDLRAQLLELYPPPPETTPLASDASSSDFRTLPLASRPRYDGLLIFRGLLEQNMMPEGLYESILKEGCGNFNVFYDRGEKLYWGCYPVPPFRKSTDKRARFNWFMYVLRPKEEMVKTLTDRNGERHLYSLPPGTISPHIASDFLSFVSRNDVLGKWPHVVQAINLTAQLDRLFVQAVWSYSPFHVAFPEHRTILLGDAAALASPTTTTGAQRCFDDSLAIVKTLSEEKDVKMALAKSEELRVADLRGIVERGVRRVSSIQPFLDALLKL